jgi:hypothetical protein
VASVGVDCHMVFMVRCAKGLPGSRVRPARIPHHIRMLRVISTSIAAAGYDRDRQILRIRFIGGGTYDYLHVPANIFESFLDAPSKGQFVNWQIKPYYRYTRLK